MDGCNRQSRLLQSAKKGGTSARTTTDETVRDAIGGANKLGGGAHGDDDAVGIHDRRVVS